MAVTFDMSEYRAFFQRMERAARGDFRREMELYLEALGFEFLKIVQDEIVRSGHKKAAGGLLAASFTKGKSGNVWEIADGGLTLEVGTNVEYASFVENGHWTLDPEKPNHFVLPNGELARFVPGYWDGEEFVYDKNAKEGMVLKLHFVEGKHFFDHALRAFEPVFKASAEAKLREWLQKYFEGV